ncbi:MAG: helix-turn-helix transcriptional regulator [Acidobacteria bacterium]|nr:helix-turn-helix transcriptional regulator [Acidobacteriota bacterium]
MTITESLGLALRQCREQLRISQEELAHRAGLDRTYISGIERGRRNPSLLTIERIAKTLGVEVEVLFQIVSKIQQEAGKEKQ